MITEKNNCGIYRILCIAEGKDDSDCYVGQAVNLKKRKSIHFSQLKRKIHFNKYLQNVYNKYGEENFVFEILCYCEKNKEELGKWETYYKNYFNAKYNLRKVEESNLGIKYSEESKRKISESNKGRKDTEESRMKKRNSHIGIRPTEQTRKKLSDRQIGQKNHNYGKKTSDETRKKQSEKNKGVSRNLGIKRTEKQRIAISERSKGKTHSEESKKKMSESKTGVKINARIGKSGYIGVIKVDKRWEARITHMKKRLSIGSYDTPEKAAIAYNEKAIELYGNNIRLNVIK